MEPAAIHCSYEDGITGIALLLTAELLTLSLDKEDRFVYASAVSGFSQSRLVKDARPPKRIIRIQGGIILWTST